MLKVTIGVGVKVSVVNDETVMPLKLSGESSTPDDAVTTTTEWDILRIMSRNLEESTGSAELVEIVVVSCDCRCIVEQ